MRLVEVASLVRSKNAGPFTLTIDIMLPDRASYETVRDNDRLRADIVGPLLGTAPEAIDIFACEAANAFKISFPRPTASGSVTDVDVYGGQFHWPLLDLEVTAR